MKLLRLVIAGLACALVASVAIGSPTPTSAQIVPLPPLPPPPEGGNPLADLLGPATGNACDAVAIAFALAGPIATAQLPPDLATLVDQVTPYLSLATYACGFLAVPPSKQVCGIDQQVAATVGGLGLNELGVPVNVPPTAAVTYETVAGIETVFLRAGVDIGRDASLRLAETLGCSIPPTAQVPPAKPAPTFADTPGTEAVSGSTSFVAIDRQVGLPPVPSVIPGRTIPAVVRTGPTRYPVDGRAILFLGLPLVILAAGALAAPRFRKATA